MYVMKFAMLYCLKLKYISWNSDILFETEIYCLRLRYLVWNKDILFKTYRLLLPLQFYSIYSLSPCILFSLAINFFSLLCLFNSFIIYLFTFTLLPLLLKFLSLSTAHLSSAPIYYICFNLCLLSILNAAFTLQYI